MADYADAATERHPAQHACRDHCELEALANHRLARGHARSEDHPGQGADQAMHGKDDDLGAIDVNPGQQRGFLVTADGHGVAPIGGVVEQPAKKHKAQHGDDDRHRHAHQLAVAEHKETFIHHADGLAVGEDVGQAAHDLHGRQGCDQCVDAQLGDDNAVDQPHHQAHGQRRRHTEYHAVGVADHDPRHHAGASDHRTDRQVEVPGGQAEQHGARRDAHGGNRQAQPTHIQR
ncbi:hypothetical protein PS682_05677 [Pseudomonas fluorescens]|nr:hypothetical protein PS682_05677 [Pseudomonas fluorescens]